MIIELQLNNTNMSMNNSQSKKINTMINIYRYISNNFEKLKIDAENMPNRSQSFNGMFKSDTIEFAKRIILLNESKKLFNTKHLDRSFLVKIIYLHLNSLLD